MNYSRTRRLLVFILFLFFALSVVSGAQAEFHGERQTFSRDFAFTNAEANVTEEMAPDLEPENSFAFELGNSGSGSLALECAAPGGQPSPFFIYWVSGPVFMDPPEELRVDDAYIRPTTDLNWTLTLSDGAGELGGLGPVASGDVTFNMKAIGWVNPGATSVHWHTLWSDEQVVSPNLDLGLPEPIPQLDVPAGPISGPITFDISTSDESTPIRQGALLVFDLEITCEDAADFTLEFGGPVEMEYIWGDAGDDDQTGGGIPDRWAMFPDGTAWSHDEQIDYGTDPFDPTDTPDNDSICEGYTIQEAKDENPDFERGNPDTCPGAGGLNWLLLLLLVLIVVGLAGGAFGAVTTVNKKIRMTVSHDGFQDIAKGESARYELLVSAKGKEDEEVPVELSLKGVPEDWSATVEPAHLTLIAGEEAEPVTAALTVTPPPEEEYEAEAVVTVTATPTDEDGKTSPMKPGTSVKTKTIVNIDVEPPEGEKRKKVKKPKSKDAGEEETMAADEGDEDSGGKKKFAGALGMLKRKGKKEDDADEEGQESGEEGEEESAQATSEDPAAGTAAVAEETGKPDLKVGEMSHEPSDFSAGDEVTTTVPVKNSGDGAVEGLLLRLYVNDDRVDEKEVDLQPGDTTEVIFTWTAQPDENRVRVRGGLKEE